MRQAEAVQLRNIRRVDVPMAYTGTIQPPDGKTMALSQFRGRALFINLWATWCGPCRRELKPIQNLYSSYKDNKGISFLMITSEALPELQNFVRQHPFDMPVFAATAPLPQVLTTSSIPVTFLVSKSGRIVAFVS